MKVPNFTNWDDLTPVSFDADDPNLPPRVRLALAEGEKHAGDYGGDSADTGDQRGEILPELKSVVS